MDKEKLEAEILKILKEVKEDLHSKMSKREEDMVLEVADSHVLFKILGYGEEEAKKIDLYHNLGRLVYRSSANLMEKIVIRLLEVRKGSVPLKISNPFPPPKEFRIDACIKSEKRAYEIKWRHATTDGDHVNKEIQKPISIKEKGWKPIHLVFFTSNRKNAITALNRIANSYRKVGGEVYIGKEAWEHLKNYTGFDLWKLLFENA